MDNNFIAGGDIPTSLDQGTIRRDTNCLECYMTPLGTDFSNNPMVNALKKVGIFVGMTHTDLDRSPYDSDIWALMVGEKWPPFLTFPFEGTIIAQWTYLPLRK
jgi:hypothetical protein